MEDGDLYERLGVPRGADATTLRRAYRRLALRFHPDRAGAGATATFQRIAAAYDVLSDPQRRAAYDRTRGGSGFAVASQRSAAAGVREEDRVLSRLCGSLSDLVAAGAARMHDNGTVDLRLTRPELDRGGTAVVTIQLPVTCGVCGGLSRRHGFDCELCGFDGSVLAPVDLWIPLPPQGRPGQIVAVPFDRLLATRVLLFRICCDQSDPPQD